MTSSARRPETVRIAVFARAPVAGAVKTRLIPRLGEEGAARLHAALVRRALDSAVRAGAWPVELWCTPDARHPFFAGCASEFGASLHVQQGADLGRRMEHAFDRALGDNAALVLIGSDCPALSPGVIAKAAGALSSHDAVVAPAEDGGYVLLGLARPVPELFAGIAWGGPEVMAQTRARLAGAGVDCRELETFWDIDRPEDHARLEREGLLRAAS